MSSQNQPMARRIATCRRPPGHIILEHSCEIYDSETQFLDEIESDLIERKIESCLIYSQAHELRTKAISSRTRSQDQTNIWIILRTLYIPYSAALPTIELALSYSDGKSGSQPALLYSNVTDDLLNDEFLHPRVTLLVQTLFNRLVGQSVVPVFGPLALVRAFQSAWSTISQTPLQPEASFNATSTFCTRQTLRLAQPIDPSTDRRLAIRPAAASDARRAVTFCEQLAGNQCVYCPFPSYKTFQQIQRLVRNKNLWICEVESSTGTRELVSIVAISTSGTQVQAITMLYANPATLQEGFAERLVQHVCNEILFKQQSSTDSVLLYVPSNNVAAQAVFNDVGFIGLQGGSPIAGVRPWAEYSLTLLQRNA